MEFIKHRLFKISICACTGLVALLLASAFYTGDAGFKAEQLKNKKVKTAYTEKWEALQKEIRAKGIGEKYGLLLRVFKQEKKLEAWIKNNNQQSYTLLKTYDICASSGTLGPKRKEGDGQVPEGFYTIDLFNPNSNYYLSLRVSYPNSSDKILSYKKYPGGAIMIHGNCVTIGCIPITDDKIKELYILALEARNNGSTLPVHIYPCYLSDANLQSLEQNYSSSLLAFWKNLQPVYDYFLKNKCSPTIKVAKDGKYYF